MRWGFPGVRCPGNRPGSVANDVPGVRPPRRRDNRGCRTRELGGERDCSRPRPSHHRKRRSAQDLPPGLHRHPPRPPHLRTAGAVTRSGHRREGGASPPQTRAGSPGPRDRGSPGPRDRGSPGPRDRLSGHRDHEPSPKGISEDCSPSAAPRHFRVPAGDSRGDGLGGIPGTAGRGRPCVSLSGKPRPAGIDAWRASRRRSAGTGRPECPPRHRDRTFRTRDTPWGHRDEPRGDRLKPSGTCP